MPTDVFAEGDSALKEMLSIEVTLEVTGKDPTELMTLMWKSKYFISNHKINVVPAC